MTLDLPTLMVMQSFALGCAGAVLIFAWLQNRTEPVLGVWGTANLLAAGGFLSLMFGVAWREAACIVLGGSLLSCQASLIWKAARNLDAKSAPLPVALLAPALVALGSYAPVIRDNPGALALAVGATFTLATAVTLWAGRSEKLIARWPLIILAGVHEAALLIGIYSTFSGATGRTTLPPLASLFGFIYFESIVFALGTSAFVFALVKERNEAVSMKAARIDPLTGIANRAAFLDGAVRLLERCRHDEAPVSVMMFDLDRFKTINDRHGHAIGDAVLRQFCGAGAAALRPGDIFGRMGGEEFAIVLPGSSIEAAGVRADRIRVAFAESCRKIGDRQVDATVSVGVSGSLDAKEALDVLLEYAYRALYGAKTEGRNRVKRAELPHTDTARSNVFRVA
ncbi:MAG: GGDEF domain-containing protein [Xanthobacteraceae bacterium]